MSARAAAAAAPACQHKDGVGDCGDPTVRRRRHGRDECAAPFI